MVNWRIYIDWNRRVGLQAGRKIFRSNEWMTSLPWQIGLGVLCRIFRVLAFFLSFSLLLYFLFCGVRWNICMHLAKYSLRGESAFGGALYEVPKAEKILSSFQTKVQGKRSTMLGWKVFLSHFSSWMGCRSCARCGTVERNNVNLNCIGWQDRNWVHDVKNSSLWTGSMYGHYVDRIVGGGHQITYRRLSQWRSWQSGV